MMSMHLEILSLALAFGAIVFPAIFFATDRACKACERKGINVNSILHGE